MTTPGVEGTSPESGVRVWARSWRLAGRHVTWRSAVGILATVLFVAVGLVGATRYVWTYWLFRGFAAPSTPTQVITGRGHSRAVVAVAPTTVVSFTLTTPALDDFPDPVDVVLPPHYAEDPTVRYPTLYLLHGQPGEPQNYLDIGNVQGVEATLVAEHRMKPMIIVLPTGSPGFLDDTEWADATRPGNAWLTFVATDLVAAIDKRYRTIPDGADRVIGGFSEGAYGALNIALHHVGEFDTIESWSGYMSALHMPTIFGTDPAVYRENSPVDELRAEVAKVKSTGTYFWMYTGTAEPYAHQQTVRFATELTRLGIPNIYIRASGTHDWALWRGMVPTSLIAASDHVAGG